MQVLAHRRVDDPRLDGQRLANLRKRLVSRGCGKGQHLRPAQRRERRIDALVRGAVRGVEEVVRFVDDDQRRPRNVAAKPLQMELHELRRRADDVPVAALQRLVQRRPLAAVDRAVGPVDPQPERSEPRLQRFVLVVRERAQRVEHDRLAAGFERAHRGGILKAKRLPASGAEDRERIPPGVEPLQDRALRLAQGLIADQRAQDVIAHHAGAVVPNGDGGFTHARDEDVDAVRAASASGDLRDRRGVAFAVVDVGRDARRDLAAQEAQLQRTVPDADCARVVRIAGIAPQLDRLTRLQRRDRVLTAFEADADHLGIETARIPDRRVRIAREKRVRFRVERRQKRARFGLGARWRLGAEVAH